MNLELLILRVALYVFALAGAVYTGELLDVGHVRTGACVAGVTLVVLIVALLIEPYPATRPAPRHRRRGAR